MIYGPSLRYNNGGHVIHHRKQGCVYINGLSGPTFCPGSERAGYPCGVITDAPCCTPRQDESCDAAASSSLRRALRAVWRLSGGPVDVIMGEQRPHDAGIFIRQRRGRDIGAFPAFERPQPSPLWVAPSFGSVHDGSRPMNQERPHIPTASF